MASLPSGEVSVAPGLQGLGGPSWVSVCSRTTLNFDVVTQKVGVIKPAPGDSWEKSAGW